MNVNKQRGKGASGLQQTEHVASPGKGRVTILVVAFKRSKTPRSSTGGVPEDDSKSEIRGYYLHLQTVSGPKRRCVGVSFCPEILFLESSGTNAAPYTRTCRDRRGSKPARTNFSAVRQTGWASRISLLVA